MKPYYQTPDGTATLYMGDCLEVLPALKAEGLSGAVGMVLSDPPYGIGELAWDSPVDWPAYFAAERGLPRRNAARVYFCNFPCGAAMLAADRRSYRYDMVWDTVNPSGHLNARVCPMRGHQNVLVFYSARPVYHPQRHRATVHTPDKPLRTSTSENYTAGRMHTSKPWKDDGTRFPSSIFSFMGAKGSYGDTGKNLHPTQKPVAALEYLVATYTDPGDLVLDPFAGSGSTGVAALRLGRRCVLVEKEEKYCEAAARRLSEALSTP